MGLGHTLDGRLHIGVKLSETWYGAESNSPAPLQEWILLTGVINRDTKEVKTYINGNLVSSSPLPDTGYSHSGLPSWIGGCSWMGGVNLAICDIDEVIIYQRALTDSEILQIYNAGINNPPIAQDDSYMVDQGDVLTVPSLGVLANDVDPESDQLTASCVSTPI